MLWGDLIRHYHGYHDDDEEEAGLEDPELVSHTPGHAPLLHAPPTCDVIAPPLQGHWTDELLLRWGAGPGRGSAPSCTS